MTKANVAQLMEFGMMMGREFPEARPDDVAELVRLAKRHGRLQEQSCNEPMPEDYDAGCERDIRDVCERIGCRAIFGGDPRGFTVKLILPSGRSNHWGGQTWGVPQ